MLLYMALIDDPQDASKFEALYMHYRGYMFGIANNILKDRQEAEDAVHNAFLSVAKHMDKVGDIESLQTKGFITVIIEHKAISLFNRRKRHAATPLLEHTAGIKVNPMGEHDIRWAITQLPPRYRQIVLLKYALGFSIRECAILLEISVDAASKLDWRAKQRLRDLCVEVGLIEL